MRRPSGQRTAATSSMSTPTEGAPAPPKLPPPPPTSSNASSVGCRGLRPTHQHHDEGGNAYIGRRADLAHSSLDMSIIGSCPSSKCSGPQLHELP